MAPEPIETKSFLGVNIVVIYQVFSLFALMGRKRNHLPSRLLHKPSGQDRVIFGGRTIYLGPHDSPEALANYARILSNIATTGDAEPRKSEVSIDELAKRYMANLRATKPEDSGEPAAIERAVNALKENFGHLEAKAFGTGKLMQLRDKWAERLCVSTVNKYHNYVVTMFRWAAMTEQVPAEVWHNLLTVPKLKPKQSKARDPKIVKPVPWSIVEQTLPHLSPTLQDVVMMQRHTGMRSGEVLRLTLDQIEGGVYRPRRHKTLRHGHAREVPLGPRAMEIINRREPTADGFLFGGYTSGSYARAINRACRKHGIPPWTSHQIRHAKGTDTLRKHGVAAARAILGHKSLNMVARYAASSVDDAKRAVEKDG